MTDLSPLFPRQTVPALTVPLVGGGTYDIAAEKPERFSLVVVYRGLHCPICKGYLNDLHSKLDEFTKRGVGVVTLSSDDKARAERARDEWKLDRLRIGYDLNFATARSWGLYLSRSRGPTSLGIEEPAIFVEPGLFLVRSDGKLYFGSVQTMPFARPHFADILSALDFVIAKDYPARGEVIETAAALAA